MMIASMKVFRISPTSIRGIGAVMMGFRRRSGPWRTDILSSLVRLRRGPRMFKSCFPRTIKSRVCWSVNKRKSIWFLTGSKTKKKKVQHIGILFIYFFKYHVMHNANGKTFCLHQIIIIKHMSWHEVEFTFSTRSHFARGACSQVVHYTHNVQLTSSVWQQLESGLKSKWQAQNNWISV